MKSDDTLLIVAVIAVLVSAVGLFVSYSSILPLDVRFAPTNTSTGTINVTVVANTAINFSVNNINWSSGFHPPNTDFVILSTSNGSNGTNWRTVTQGFVLDNLGTVNVTLFVKTEKNATQFIGGSLGGGPVYQYNVTNLDAGACGNTTGFNLGVFRDVNNTVGTLGDKVCGGAGSLGPGFFFNGVPGLGGQNSIRIDVLLRIPSDAIKDSFLGDTMTATAQAVS